MEQFTPVSGHNIQPLSENLVFLLSVYVDFTPAYFLLKFLEFPSVLRGISTGNGHY